MLDLEDLRDEVRVMTRETKLYKLLKEELTARGYWKNKKRGKNREDIAGVYCS